MRVCVYACVCANRKVLVCACTHVFLTTHVYVRVNMEVYHRIFIAKFLSKIYSAVYMPFTEKNPPFFPCGIFRTGLGYV